MIIITWCHPLMGTWNLSLDVSPWESPNPHRHRKHIDMVSTQSTIDNFLPYHKIPCGTWFALVCWPSLNSIFNLILVNLYLCSMINLCLEGHIELFTMLHCFKTWSPISQFTMTISSFSMSIILVITCSFSCSNIISWEAQWILHLNYLLQDIIIHDSTYELIMILSSSHM